ncbi:MBOAT family O-acyltransferase [Algibacter pectinivorans]|uniref:Alginate O-acetyltransferase complex protein AlgI n=1 Tax=Algibacter pectinivorans TaxID=870482 RepID=A0A1I1NEA6_9FLAO|nr:MBOAT family O-acyltransferase [Algibacter pectinivorans]SFC95959.1 alginate O-acetyltransferase complex protein AlgI [Algibacter pectinivorans]
MVFTSPTFLFLFLPLVLLLYYYANTFFRNITLLVFSLLFYAWGEGLYLLLMIISIVFNYFFGLLIGRDKKNNKRRLLLFVAVVFNLSLIFYFKYTAFLVSIINDFFNLDINTTPIHLPLGISFFTFQSISYLVDVYRQEVPSQKKIINLGLYISLFPQLIAGPIVRYSDINLQLNTREHSFEKFSNGIYRFTIGLVKKMVIANPLGYIADQVFAIDSNDLSMPLSWIGILCYSFQIYYDFSGYSDMAIGLGKMFGFKFEENFNHPYISKSVQEFWRRWHISLSSWFRDYLYIPLGGNRLGKKRLIFNLIVVFFLTGFWHGASWNFIFWGLFHGLFISLERIQKVKTFLKAKVVLSHCYTLIIVVVAWVFFRAQDLSSSFKYLFNMFNFKKYSIDLFEFKTIVSNEAIFVFILAIIFAIPIRKKIENMFQFNEVFWGVSRVLLIVASLILVISKVASSTYNPFIYFRF